ncbi:glycosyltransferase family 2 protein [Lactobacillus delbrueckii]|uniref:glycosyltransferase family 2 protein n=1 Tax=Lactobacillus delbrueckii TaxID=1584 RepID=UPI0022E783F3|nr:glycosyltransferase family 2 protein [Lactobacillus delbrueckii]
MKIVAGVVLYNPEVERLSKNLKACMPQVDSVVFIDNGSKNILEIQEILKSEAKVALLKNKSNQGIAYALNQVLDYAKEQDADFFLTLDQDSVMERGYVSKMIDEVSANQQLNRVGIVCPQTVDVNLPKSELKHGIELIQNPKVVVTSGCLTNTKAATEIGGYDNNLFVDYVDVDFNERLLLAGYQIVRNNETILHHELGRSEYRRILGLKILVDNHNVIRRYYITRNRLWFSKRYFGTKGYFKERVKVLMTIVKILLFEDDKSNKIQAIHKGINDFKNGVTGQYED